jgi:hypothetical protein
MPTTKQRPPASVSVPKLAIEQATMTLLDLPERPKETWSLREAVAMLQDSITDALDKGYSYEEVAKLLGSKGVSITASSLKRYLAAARRQSDGGVRTRRTRRPRGVASAAVAEAAAPAETTEAPKRRGRRASTGEASAPTKTAAKSASKAATTTAKTPADTAEKAPRGRKPRASATAAKSAPQSTARGRGGRGRQAAK